jgi:alkylation response protein AidB-like acyl-CoA dehydrogenase
MKAHDTDIETADFRQVIRRFCEKRLAPGAAERDRTCEFPGGLMAEMGTLDLMGISVPLELGGLGLPSTVQLQVIEDVARADASIASIYTAHYLALEALLAGADQAQKLSLLPRLCSGELLAGFALTEPGAGSDIGSMETTAHRTEDGWRLSGSKTFISNAREADVMVLFAKTEEHVKAKGISAFIVPKGTPGVTFSKAQDKLGIRSAPTYTVYLADVLLPAESIVGEPGSGARTALTALNPARIDVAAMANGISARALDLAREYASERVQFGRPIADFQAIQLLLGEMDARLAASRAVTRWAGELKDEGGDLRRVASIAKYVASEACTAVVDSALQIHGGAGFMKESEIERLYRDSRILRIFEGTSQIQLLTIAANPPREGSE